MATVADRHRRIALALIAATDDAPPNRYVVRHLAGHVAAAGAWAELASAAVLDQLAPNSVATQAFRNTFGRADLPIEIAGIMSCHHLLADLPPGSRFAVRQLANARLGGAVRRGPDTGPWSVRWAAMQTESLNLVLGSHDGKVRAITTVPFPDGRVLLATGGEDGTLRLWDPVAGAPIGQPVAAHTESVSTVAAVPLADGRVLLATGGADGGADDGVVRLWDPTTATRVGELTDHWFFWIDTVTAITLTDGRVLMAAGSYGYIRLWDLATGAPADQLKIGKVGECTVLLAVPLTDGQVLLVAGRDYDEALWLWDPVARTMVGKLHTATGGLRAAATVPLADGRVLLAAGGPDGLQLWDLRTRQLVSRLVGVGWPNAIASIPLPGGRVLLATGGSGGLRLWNPTTGLPNGGPLTRRTNATRTMATVSLAGGRVLLASGGDDGAVRLWDLTNRSDTVASGTTHTNRVVDVATLPAVNGRTLLATAGSDGTVRLWESDTGAPAGEPLTAHDKWVQSVAATRLAGDRVLMATGGCNGVRLWDMSSGRPVPQQLPEGGPSAVMALVFMRLPGRTLLAAAASDTRIWIWELSSREPVCRQLPGPRIDHKTYIIDGLAGVRLPGGYPLLLVISGDIKDQAVRLWDPTTGKAMSTLAIGRDKRVEVATAVPLFDGRDLLAVGLKDGTVDLWDPVDRAPVRDPLTGHSGRVNAAAAVTLPDGRVLLATGGDDGTVRLWDPLAGKSLHTIVIGDQVRSIAQVESGLAVALNTGVVVFNLNL
jgi:WD40 repeat protein